MAPSCAEGGVLGVLPGIMGTLQATEALKLLLGIGEPLVGRLLLVDALEASSTRSRCAATRTARSAASTPSEINYIDYEQFCAGPTRASQRTSRRTDMPVKLRMPPILRPQVGGAREVEADGGDAARGRSTTCSAAIPPSATSSSTTTASSTASSTSTSTNEDVRLGDGLETARARRLDRDRAPGDGRRRDRCPLLAHAAPATSLSAIGSTRRSSSCPGCAPRAARGCSPSSRRPNPTGSVKDRVALVA